MPPIGGVVLSPGSAERHRIQEILKRAGHTIFSTGDSEEATTWHSASRADLGTHAIHAAQRRRIAGARQRRRFVEYFAGDGVQQPHQIRRSDFTPDRMLSVVDQLVRPQTTPAEVEAEGLNGFALLKSVAETDGSARLVKVGISSGWSMIDDAASSAAAQWKYEPALVDGKPVRSVIEHTLYFGKGSR